MASTYHMTARFAGKCTCSARVRAGARITWDASTRKITQCSWCRPIEKRVSIKRAVSMLTAFEYFSDPLGETYPMGLNGPRNPWR